MPCASCGTPNHILAATCAGCGASLPGGEGSTLAGRYEIRSCLGKGGMGVVYKAYDRVLDEVVAIKVLLGERGRDARATRRFLTEIKLARKVTHRNVCRIHDYGEDAGLPFISMQFVEGADLRERVRGTDGLPPAEACHVALQIAEGLQAIHDEGIVHRDLKTANVMIDHQGVARLMDFGIAKSAEGGESLTGTGHIVGTPEYMSPEQIQGQPLDPRSDLYSLGVILFELCTGRVPFSAGTAVGTLMKHLQEEPPLTGSAGLTIPPGVREVIRQALAKQRDGRYTSARELAHALRGAIGPQASAGYDGGALTRTQVRPPAPTQVQPPIRPSSRRRPAVLLGAFVLAVPLAAGVVWTAWAGWGSPGASPAPTPPRTGSLDPAGTPATLPVTVPTVPPLTPEPIGSMRISDSPERTCESGDSAACLAAGQRYESGDGVSRDDRRAATFHRRACDLGSAAGCTHLGVLHNAGRGVEMDLAAAALFYEKGCDGGDAAGCNNLGTLYEFGRTGFGPDEKRAAGFYRRACDSGDPQGCGNLGIVALGDPALAGGERQRAIQLVQQSCASRVARACRKLQDLGL